MEMLQRGTKSRSAQQIAELVDSIGGDLETGCGNNSWFWHFQTVEASGYAVLAILLAVATVLVLRRRAV